MNVLLTWTVFGTVSDPPVSWNATWLVRLLTVCVPEEWVTVMDVLDELITTSSLVPGNAPMLQFVTVFQSPLPPTQDTVTDFAEKQNIATSTAAKHLDLKRFIRLPLLILLSS